MLRQNTQNLVIQALLLSLCVVLSRFASVRIAFGGVEGVRIGLGALPLIMAGVFFGPVSGAVVGATADIVGYLLSPLGPYMPHFTLTAALQGFIPGLFFTSRLYSLRFSRLGNRGALFIGISLSQVMGGLFLTPYFLHLLFEIPLNIVLIPRLVSVPIQIILYFYLFSLLLKAPPVAVLMPQLPYRQKTS